MKKFIEKKEWFGNGFRTWDGFECPRCGGVFDPDAILFEKGKLTCPSCFWAEGEAEAKVDWNNP